MSFILDFFDFFLPASLRNNSSDLMRGYIIIGLMGANILVVLLAWQVYCFTWTWLRIPGLP